MPSSLLDWVTIFSQGVLVIIALLGLFSYWKWRTELVGKAKYELALKILKLANEYRWEINNFRNIFYDSQESIDRKEVPGETPEMKQDLDNQYVHMKRLQNFDGIYKDFYMIEWETKIQLDKKGDNSVSSLIQDLQKKYSDILFAYNSFYSSKRSQINRRKPLTQEEESKEYEKRDTWYAILYGYEGDEFSTSVNIIIDSLANKLAKYIK